WSTDSWMGPACVYTPSTTAMVTAGIQLLAARDVPFAIRGGGFMPVSNAANIGPEGILFSNTNMTSLNITADNSVVTVGAGIKFGRLYDFLAPLKVIVNGVRLGDVGVVGFHLGGGIGFFSYEHGVAPTTVESFECVLGNGTAVTASNSSNPDLFWALRGGGNNFCYVTSLSLYTIPSESIALGNIAYGSGAKEAYINGMTEFALNAGSDPKTSCEGQSRWNPSRSADVTYHSFLFNSDNNPSAPGLVNLTAPVLPPISGNVTTDTSMSDWYKLFQGFPDFDNRKRFLFYSIPASTEAFTIATDTYYKVIQEAGLADVRGFFTALSVMPITSNIIAASTGNGGNPLGLNASSVPALWLVESPSWKDGESDILVDSTHEKANAEIKANLEAAGHSMLPFVYLSDAAKGQPVFEGYGTESWDRLKAIRDVYDPAEVFQKLVTGGAKVTAERGQSAK
ncbi:hypothetical protein BKA61DRAFT_492963, partial [Leptodontidium sp. MPI-SDFR-AT-0119]